MLLADFIRNSVSRLEPLYPQAEAHNIVLLLCESLIGTKNYTHIVEPQFEIDKKWNEPLEKAMSQLESGEPLQYVTGKSLFCGRTFRVNKAVLIPRPETELLVREAVNIAGRLQRMRKAYGKSADPVRILDLCTGSGNIAWSMALEVPGAKVVGVDVSEAALDVAKSQNFYQEMKEKGAIAPTFIAADILDTEQDFNYGPFDLILSNPPYIMEKEKVQMRRNVLDFEPASALFVSDDDPLVFYRAIAQWSKRFFSPEGRGFTEINETLSSETAAVFRDYGFSEIDVAKDFFDKTRFVSYKK